MKQLLRFFLKPSVFFNQLQWSSHHWFILLSFLSVSLIETHFGKYGELYQTYVTLLNSWFGLSFNQALFVITVGKLSLMLAGAYVMINFIWMVGNLLGRKNSKRVLFRRMAVVFTVLLAGFTSSHLMDLFPPLFFASLAFYFWGLTLGYFAIREQFELTRIETVVVTLFALLVVTSTWHYSNHLVEVAARHEMQSLTRSGEAPSHFSVPY